MVRISGQRLGLVIAAGVLALWTTVLWTTAGALAQVAVNPLSQPSAERGSPEVVIPDRLSPAEVDRVLAGLTDAQVRQLLNSKLKQSAESQAARAKSGGGGGIAIAMVMFRNRIIGSVGVLQTRWGQLQKGLAITPGELAKSFDKVTAGRGFDGLLSQLAGLLAILAAGFGARWLVLRLTGARARENPAAPIPGFGARLGEAAHKALFEILAVAAFALVAVAGAALAYGAGSSPDKTFVITYVTAVLLVLSVRLALGAVLAPGNPERRLAPLTDQTAGFLFGWTLLIATVGVFSWLTAGLLILTGMALGAHLTIVMATGAIVAGLLMAMIFQSRAVVATLIRGDADAAAADPVDRLRARFARSWHVLAILYLLAVWFLWSMSMLAQDASAVWAAIGSVLVVALLPLLDRMARGLLIVRPAAAEDAQGQTQEPGHYGVIVLRAVRAVLLVAAGLAILQLWGVGLVSGGGPEAEGAVLAALFDISLTIVLAFLVWELTKIAIDRSLASEEDGTQEVKDGEGMGSNPSSRSQTLLPLIRKFILVVLFAMTTMIVLSSLGVDIGPLLAGAGVVGLAIGFGAQTLVRDVVSGVFFLIDDAFRLGEYVDLGSVKGEVEAINLRSLRLRHHRGAVNTIPFGELHAIVNYSRDWAIYKMEFRLPFDTDIDKVRKIVKKIGLELLEDEEFGPMFIEPLKSQGVLRTDESALIIRTKFTSKPGEQFYIRREAYKRIRDKFQEAGIEFAPRTVSVGAAPGGPAAAAAAVGATPGPASGPPAIA